MSILKAALGAVTLADGQHAGNFRIELLNPAGAVIEMIEQPTQDYVLDTWAASTTPGEYMLRETRLDTTGQPIVPGATVSWSIKAPREVAQVPVSLSVE